MTAADVIAERAAWAIEQRDATLPWPLPDGSVAAIVTSPPYWGLRDYGVAGQLGLERDPQEYVERLVQVLREARRVLDHYGTLWLNLGDTFYTAKGSCWNPGGSAMSIHQERVTAGAVPHARNAPNRMMPTSRARELGLKPKDLVGIPWRVAFALQADGWYLRSDIVWAKPNPMPESVSDRPTRAHEYLFLLSKSRRYYYDIDAIREPIAQGTIDRLSQPGFDAQPGGAKDYANGTNPSRSARKAMANVRRAMYAVPSGWDTGTGRHDRLAGRYGNGDRTVSGESGRAPDPGHVLPGPLQVGRNARSVWTIATEPYSEAHFATFPAALVERCVKAGSRPGGIVLDPFSGAGTTVLVADRLGRRGIGFDLKSEYCELARRRIRDDCPMFSGPETPADPTQAELAL